MTSSVVTVFWRENGLPTATTNSPGLSSDERPSKSTGKGVCLKQLDIVYYIHSCNTYFANSWYLKKKKKKKKTSSIFLRSFDQ